MHRSRTPHLTTLLMVVLVATAPTAAQLAAPAEEPLAEVIEAMFAAAYPDDTGPGAAMIVVVGGEVV